MGGLGRSLGGGLGGPVAVAAAAASDDSGDAELPTDSNSKKHICIYRRNVDGCVRRGIFFNKSTYPIQIMSMRDT